MKHPRGKLSSHEIPPGEISVFGYLMGPQNKKPITFLKTVTSYETPRGKLHYKVLTKCFVKFPLFTGFFRSLTGNFRRKL